MYCLLVDLLVCACIGRLCCSSCVFFPFLWGCWRKNKNKNKADRAYTEFSAALCLPVRRSDESFSGPLAPTPPRFLIWCVPLDIVQIVDLCALSSLCISQYVYSTWVCMAVVVLIFILTLNRYLFWVFFLHDWNEGRCKSVINVRTSGMFPWHRCFTQAVLPVFYASWMCHNKYILHTSHKIHIYSLLARDSVRARIHKGYIQCVAFLTVKLHIYDVTSKEII